jgi:hypothetical protein
LDNFTLVSALSGGILIALATALLLLFNGRIADQWDDERIN